MIDAPIIAICFSAKDIKLTRSKEKQGEEKPKVRLVHDYHLVYLQSFSLRNLLLSL
jgi:hypothetical protein